MINLRKGSAKEMRKTSENNMDIEGNSESEKKVRFVLEKFQ